MKRNNKINLSGKEAVAILKEVETMLISLDKIGWYYIDKDKTSYAEETNRFIDNWKIVLRLAKIRSIISRKFDLSVGNDDMDDLERALQDVDVWRRPGDNPKK